MAELTSYVIIAALNGLTGEEIRTTGSIFRAQSEALDRLLGSDETLLLLHPELGWVYRPGYRTEVVRINRHGLRADREYSPLPPACVVRVAAYGDSFVYGSEVDNPNAWPALVEAEKPSIEVLNYGVGGYGLDQALLRFLSSGDELSPHLVLVGLTPIMLRRNVNVYRRFMSTREFPLAKPRFTLVDDGLELIENPLPSEHDYRRLHEKPELARELGRHDTLYEPAIYENPLYDISATVRLLTYLGVKANDRHLAPQRFLKGDQLNPESEAFELLVALADRFVAEIRGSGLEALFVLFPDADSIRWVVDGKASIYTPLLPAIAGSGARVVDLVDVFAAGLPSAATIDRWFMAGGHYSPAGNRLVAEALATEIERSASLTGLIGEGCSTTSASPAGDRST